MPAHVEELLRSFEELELDLLYAILRERQKVFVVEQECPYLDADDLDRPAMHLMFMDDSDIRAYSRLLPPGTEYDGHSSFGRVLTVRSLRGSGFGRRIVERSIYHIRQLWPEHPVMISAQEYLLEFYRDFGFEPVGEMYLLDDIAHRKMELSV